MRAAFGCFAFVLAIVCAGTSARARPFGIGTGTLSVFAQASSPGGGTQTDDPPPLSTGPALGTYTHMAHAESASAVADIVLNAELAETSLTLSGSGLAAAGLKTNFADARGGWTQFFVVGLSTPVRLTIGTDVEFMNGSVGIFEDGTGQVVFIRSWINSTQDLTLLPGAYRFRVMAQLPMISGPRTDFSTSLAIVPVPEPVSAALVCAGCGAGMMFRRQHNHHRRLRSPESGS